MVFFGIVCLLWCLSCVLAVLGEQLHTDPEGGDRRVYVQVAVITVVFYGPLILIGLQAMARKRWALWLGAALAFAYLLIPVLSMTRYDLIKPFLDLGGIFDDKNLRVTTHSLEGVLVATQAFCYCLAIRAYYANRDAVR
jgi:hypothetical protein